MKKLVILAIAALFSAATMGQTTKQPRYKTKKDSTMKMSKDSTSNWKKKQMKKTRTAKDSLYAPMKDSMK